MSKYQIFEQGWTNDDTVCGWGSQLQHTVEVRKLLPHFLKFYNIKKMNDAGCGDLFWIKTMNLLDIDYQGYDAFKRASWDKLILQGYPLQTFDIVNEVMRPCDLIMCRDVFIHLPNKDVLTALGNFRKSGKFLLSTSFVNGADNDNRMDAPRLQHAKLDLTKEPFNLGKPIGFIPEDYPHKILGLWEL